MARERERETYNLLTLESTSRNTFFLSLLFVCPTRFYLPLPFDLSNPASGYLAVPAYVYLLVFFVLFVPLFLFRPFSSQYVSIYLCLQPVKLLTAYIFPYSSLSSVHIRINFVETRGDEHRGELRCHLVSLGHGPASRWHAGGALTKPRKLGANLDAPFLWTLGCHEDSVAHRNLIHALCI